MPEALRERREDRILREEKAGTFDSLADREEAFGIRPVRVAFLAQENHAVPPPIPGASVSRVVYELSRKLAMDPRFNVVSCSIPHPTLAEGEHEGTRYLWTDSGSDYKRNDLYIRYVSRILRRLGLPYRPLWGTPFYGIGYTSRGLRRLSEEKPDIVHLQNVSQFLPRARRVFPRARLVLHMHCDWLRELPRRVTRRRLEHADLILGVSEYITNGIRDAFPDLAERCHHLHNGADLERFAPRWALSDEQRAKVESLRARWQLGNGPVILFVKVITPETGLHVLLPAFEQLLREVPDARLLIVGTFGEYSQVSWRSNEGTEVETPAAWRERVAFRRRQRHYRHEIQALVDRVGGRAIMVGNLPNEELPSLYALADIMAVPSVWNEPFTLVALEAAACGLPVVASSRGGLPEFVQHDVTGKLVRPTDPVALSDALAELCMDRTFAARLGEAGRQRALAEYNWGRQAERLAGLYEQIL